MRIQSEWNRMHDDVERLESECKAKDAAIARLRTENESLRNSGTKCETCSLNLSLAAARKTIERIREWAKEWMEEPVLKELDEIIKP